MPGPGVGVSVARVHESGARIVELDRNDLHRTAEFATAALTARSPADVATLVRRLRLVLSSDDVHLWSIGRGGAVEWHDPEGAASPDGELVHDERSLAMSETTSFGVVHLVTRRRRRPFRAPERRLLSMLSPYLVAAVAVVDVRPARRRSRSDASGPDPEAVALSDGPSAPLTPREVEILASVARGATNKEVAASLDISPRTVQKHLEHIYDKLGVRRRTAAAGWWVDHLAG